MNRYYTARWATDKERSQHNGANGVVEIVAPREVVCFASPTALAERIAYALNLAERFDLDELQRISDALTTTEGR